MDTPGQKARGELLYLLRYVTIITIKGVAERSMVYIFNQTKSLRWIVTESPKVQALVVTFLASFYSVTSRNSKFKFLE